MLPPRREKDEKPCRLFGKIVDQASGHFISLILLYEKAANELRG
jgi:hypothetical protein